jgi:hypothetical protein
MTSVPHMPAIQNTILANRIAAPECNESQDFIDGDNRRQTLVLAMRRYAVGRTRGRREIAVAAVTGLLFTWLIRTITSE